MTTNGEPSWQDVETITNDEHRLVTRATKPTNVEVLKQVVLVEPSCQQLHCPKMKRQQHLVPMPHFPVIAVGHSDTTNGECHLVTHALKLTNEVLKQVVLACPSCQQLHHQNMMKQQLLVTTPHVAVIAIGHSDTTNGERRIVTRAMKPTNEVLEQVALVKPSCQQLHCPKMKRQQHLVPMPHFPAIAVGHSDTTNGECRLVTHATKLTNEVLKQVALVEPSSGQQLRHQNMKKQQRLVAMPHVAVIAIGHSDTTNGERHLVTCAMKQTNEVLKKAALSNKEEAAKQHCSK
jgi:hypothetical protein